MKKSYQIFYIVILNLLILGFSSCENSSTTEMDSKEPDSTKRIPVISTDYNRFIFVKNTTEDYLKSMTAEYGELAASDGNDFFAQFGILKNGDWYIIKVPDNINFYIYHNLVGWYYGYDNNPNIPDYSIGYAESKKKDKDSYLFYLDPDNINGDTHIGVFKDNKNFTIYLPESYEENGNLMANNKVVVRFKDVEKFLIDNDFKMPSTKEMKFENFEVKILQ